MYQLVFLTVFTGILIAESDFSNSGNTNNVINNNDVSYDDVTNGERLKTLLDILKILDRDDDVGDDIDVLLRKGATAGFVTFGVQNDTASELSDGLIDAENPLRSLLFGSPTFTEKSKKSARVWAEDDTIKSGQKAISRYQMRHYPYSNIVKLSSGCTGTLLTPHHVITAAHCVHDGAEFKDNIGMLKVEVPDTIGYRIHYIAKINVPVMWLRSRTLPGVIKGAYDFAVLHLNLPVSGRDKFMQLAFPTRKHLNSDMHYLGFFPHRFNQLCQSSCTGSDNLVVMNGNVALTQCEATTGNSGAAVFTDNAIDGNKIIGLLSNTVATSSVHSTTVIEYDAITLLTLSKCLDICLMIYPEGEKYSVCETVKRHSSDYMQLRNTRIVPFYG